MAVKKSGPSFLERMCIDNDIREKIKRTILDTRTLSELTEQMSSPSGPLVLERALTKK